MGGLGERVASQLVTGKPGSSSADGRRWVDAWRRTAVTAVIAACLGLWGPVVGDAVAATVQVSGSQLRYMASPGEVNNLTVTPRPTAYEFRDPGVPVTAVQPCLPAGPDGALCPRSGNHSLVADLGDRNDKLTVAVGLVDAPWLAATLNGGPGDDELVGGFGDDTLDGGTGDDSLAGGSGEDTLVGGAGADSLRGGDANDRADYSDRDRSLTLTIDGQANDGEQGEGDSIADDVEQLIGGSGPDRLSRASSERGGPGDDYLTAGFSLLGDEGNDRLIGDERMNSLAGGPGDDILDGQGDRDFLAGDSGDDVLTGGPGDDRLCGDTVDSFFWSYGYPVCGGVGADRLDGGDGDDFLVGGGGTDVFVGGEGRDQVSYADWDHDAGVRATIDGASDDGVAGEAENIGGDVERLEGSRGDDVLAGSDHAEELTGYFGNDRVEGKGGDDVLLAGPGDDAYSGGDGTDTLRYDVHIASCSCNYNSFDGLNVSLDGLAGDGAPGESDNVLPDVEGVVGYLGSDTLVGSDAPNLLSGGDGADVLDGGGGADALRGGFGNDSIRSRDGVHDEIDCDAHDGAYYADSGPGSDSASIDDIDTVSNCESVEAAHTVSVGSGSPPDQAAPSPPPDQTGGTSLVNATFVAPRSSFLLGTARLWRRTVVVRALCAGASPCRAILRVYAKGSMRRHPVARLALTLRGNTDRAVRIPLPRAGRLTSVLRRLGGRLVSSANGVTLTRQLRPLPPRS
jgi:Ca2+-binding RTX toxin-like protein